MTFQPITREELEHAESRATIRAEILAYVDAASDPLCTKSHDQIDRMRGHMHFNPMLVTQNRTDVIRELGVQFRNVLNGRAHDAIMLEGYGVERLTRMGKAFLRAEDEYSPTVLQTYYGRDDAYPPLAVPVQPGDAAMELTQRKPVAAAPAAPESSGWRRWLEKLTR